MAGTYLFQGKKLCLLALLPVINVPWAGHACMRTAHSAQCTGTVPHCREENSSRQLHFKLKKIPTSARIVFSTVVACLCSSCSQCKEAPCPLSKLSSSLAISVHECVSLFLHLRNVYQGMGDALHRKAWAAGSAWSWAPSSVCGP